MDTTVDDAEWMAHGWFMVFFEWCINFNSKFQAGIKHSWEMTDPDGVGKSGGLSSFHV